MGDLLPKKTKTMVINFTENFQFHTRLQLKGQNVEIVEKMKILGTVLTNKLNWDENCKNLIKKVNSRMQLLQKVWSFGSNIEEMVHLWKVFCRSILEQTCVLWDSGLTGENRDDLERTQKAFAKLILEEDYGSYENALKKLNIESLDARRKQLTLNFAKNSIEDGIFNDLFPKKVTNHKMRKRKSEFFKVNHAFTNRYKNSPIVTMQRMLNKDKLENL